MSKLLIIVVILLTAIAGGTVVDKNISFSSLGVSSSFNQTLACTTLHKVTLAIDGMWCASCAVGSEYNLKAIDGVADAYVGFTDDLDGEGWVVYESGKVSEEQIRKAIEPYKATIIADTVYTE